jgi:hypothetical protein
LTKDKPQASKHDDKKLKMYEKLKASVTHAAGEPMEPVDTLKYDKYSVAPDSAGSQKMLKTIVMKIIKNKRRRLEYYLILGTEVANLKLNLKLKSFTNKCSNCQPVNDTYAVLKYKCNSAALSAFCPKTSALCVWGILKNLAQILFLPAAER